MLSRVGMVFVLSVLLVILGCAGRTTTIDPAPANGSSGSEGTPAETQDPLDALYQAALKEGRVIWWGPTDAADALKVAEKFNSRFPGIQVESFEITSGEAVPRIITEDRARQYNVDVAEGNFGTVNALLERDLIAVHDDLDTLFDIPEDGLLLEGKMLSFYNLVHTIHYNTNLVAGDDIPKTWEDLLDPKWKGKILMEARAKPLGYLGAQQGEAWMTDFTKKLKQQEPIIVKGMSINDQLATGAGALSIGSYAYKAEELKRKGAPVEWIMLDDPVGASQFGIYTLKKAPNPNAAKLFAGWLGSSEGIEIMGEITGGRGPVYEGAPTKISKDLYSNNIQIYFETLDNSKEITRLEQIASEIVGGQR